jgi:hypothetical protein
MSDRRAIENRYRRKRYATDPDYRERLLADQRARQGERNQRRRDRYRHDPDYRAKQIDRARQYRERG